ncbi:MAG: TRAP transporter substrate-binding protein [Rhodospirillaceae bacterium]|nr:TRAP transporter substrate-binding protein [Rhodospirillaceae bacterium]
MPSVGWYFIVALIVLIGVILAVPSEGHGQEAGPETYIATAGATVSPGDIGDIIWNSYARTVSEKSGGKLKVKLLIRGETGGEDGMMNALMRGRIQISSFSEASMSRLVPEYMLIAAPYLFDSAAEAQFVMDNFLKQPFVEMTAKKGVVMHEFQEVGWNNIYGKKPLLSPEDTKGYRMRALPSDTSQLFLASIGADVIHLQRTELVTSLQTGLIEGGETALVLYARGGEAIYAPHFILTEHSRASGSSVFNKAWLDGLDPATRDIMLTSYQTLEEQRADAAKLYDQELARLPTVGVTVHTLTPEQRAKFREATKPNTQRLIEKIGGRAQEIYDTILEGKRAFAAQIRPN